MYFTIQYTIYAMYTICPCLYFKYCSKAAQLVSPDWFPQKYNETWSWSRGLRSGGGLVTRTEQEWFVHSTSRACPKSWLPVGSMISVKPNFTVWFAGSVLIYWRTLIDCCCFTREVVREGVSSFDVGSGDRVCEQVGHHAWFRSKIWYKRTWRTVLL